MHTQPIFVPLQLELNIFCFSAIQIYYSQKSSQTFVMSSGWEQHKCSLPAAGSQEKMKFFQNTNAALRNRICWAINNIIGHTNWVGHKKLPEWALRLWMQIFKKLIGNKRKQLILWKLSRYS